MVIVVSSKKRVVLGGRQPESDVFIEDCELSEWFAEKVADDCRCYAACAGITSKMFDRVMASPLDIA